VVTGRVLSTENVTNYTSASMILLKQTTQSKGQFNMTLLKL